jgi:hypothetical protein
MASKVMVTEERLYGFLGDVIQPGDEVFTFTQVYRRGTLVSSGIYRGVVKYSARGGEFEKYAIDRPDGKRTYINYSSNIARKSLTLAELDGYVV